MIGAHHRNAAKLEPLPAQPRNGLLLAINRLKGNRAEAYDGFGIDDRELPVQKRRAGFHFVRLRRAIFRRTALHHVADVNVFTLEAHRFDHLREQFSRAADERQSLNIFIAPRPFADETSSARGLPLPKTIVLRCLHKRQRWQSLMVSRISSSESLVTRSPASKSEADLTAGSGAGV